MTECHRCDVEMINGFAIEQTYIGGAPDFPGPDDRPITFRAGGPGRLIACWKCPSCGFSVTQARRGMPKCFNREDENDER